MLHLSSYLTHNWGMEAKLMKLPLGTSLLDLQPGTIGRAYNPSEKNPIEWIIGDLQTEHHELCLYGLTYMRRLIAWTRVRKWGCPDPQCIGITWFELFVNFRIVTQSEVPTNLSKESKKPKYCTPEQNADVLLLKLTEKAIRRLWVESMRCGAAPAPAPFSLPRVKLHQITTKNSTDRLRLGLNTKACGPFF